jgi:CDP-diacylglycerol--glycerol-3-phosphate 3-phosphatidyltransferase
MIILKEMRQLVAKTPIFTLANAVTVFRLFLLAPIFLLMRQDGAIAQRLALILVGLGWLSDGLDGYLARRMGQISELGRILDPLVDKIFVLFLFLFLIILRDFPPWMLLVVFSRDLLILGGAFYLAQRKKTVEESRFWGKLTTNAFIVTAIAYLLRWRPVAPVLLGLAVILMVISTWSYGRLFLRRLR